MYQRINSIYVARPKNNRFAITSCLIATYILILLSSSCAGLRNHKSDASPTPDSVTAKSIQDVDIPKLMSQPSQVFEAFFGKAISVSASERRNLQEGAMPIEIRQYRISNVTKTQLTEAGLMVHFYKDKAVRINVDLDKQTGNPEEALSKVKIDVKGIAPSEKGEGGHTWSNQKLSGIEFESVSAAKLDLDNQNFTTVQANVRLR